MRYPCLLLPFIFLCGLAPASAPNFIIFIADDVSWDDFGCYGNEDVQTPVIDEMAANGLKFYNTYLTASSCSPSRNSIMTGRYPHNTGAAELHTQPPDWMLSLPEVLRGAGYYTGHSGKFHMGSYAERGFDVIARSYEEIGNSGSDNWVQMVSERPQDQPFFFWFAALDAHRAWGENRFSGTHHPDDLTPPDYLANAPATRQDLAQYYDEVKRFDYRIGEVIEALSSQGVLQDTVLIVMADNGRAFPHSKTRLNDRGMKTPFVIHWPEGIERRATTDALISVIDIAPTLFDLAEVPTPAQYQGRSFAHVLFEPQRAHRSYVFAEHNWHDYEAHGRMVRNEAFMYIVNNRPNKPQLGPTDSVGSPTHNDLATLRAQGQLTPIQADLFVTPRPREELYDLRNDPQQRVNVASHPDYAEDLAAMRAIMEEWQEVTGDTVPANLTRDYYLEHGAYIRTQWYGTRGEMPGATTNATQINEPGPF